MDTTKIKQIVARHFDYAPSGTGQLLHGDWFTPKHKESMEYALAEIGTPDEELETEIRNLERKLEDAESHSELSDKTMNDENDRLQDRIIELENELEELRSKEVTA